MLYKHVVIDNFFHVHTETCCYMLYPWQQADVQRCHLASWKSDVFFLASRKGAVCEVL